MTKRKSPGAAAKHEAPAGRRSLLDLRHNKQCHYITLVPYTNNCILFFSAGQSRNPQKLNGRKSRRQHPHLRLRHRLCRLLLFHKEQVTLLVCLIGVLPENTFVLVFVNLTTRQECPHPAGTITDVVFACPAVSMAAVKGFSHAPTLCAPCKR